VNQNGQIPVRDLRWRTEANSFTNAFVLSNGSCPGSDVETASSSTTSNGLTRICGFSFLTSAFAARTARRARSASA